MTYKKKPLSIEKNSMEIIENELGEHNFDDKTLKVVKRVIHTTADFEYAKLLKFHPDAIDTGLKLMKKGVTIYADTSMVLSGVNKKALEKYDSKVINCVHDDDVYEKANKLKITRSMAAIEKASLELDVPIYAIGNAPTAIFKLIELIENKKINPKLIIGVPVGFVGAAESKEALMNLNIPYITVKGRKGGSPVAAAIVNSLFYLLGR